MKLKRLASVFVLTTSCCFSQIDTKEVEIVNDENPIEVLSSSLEKRQTIKLRLKNGLEVFIISDPDTNLSAAALSVEAGSWNDPKEYPGTAHFLEHMLFMGTEKYPDENEFFRFIQDNGGSSNAYTAPDRTVYMFSIANPAFEGACDRFSRFFIDPLFLTSGLAREMKAVDQENDKNIENDSWRAWMIFKETGNPNHPNHGFSTGNSTTLGKIPSSTLRQWYEKYYSADRMHLSIYTSASIEQAKAWAVQMFSEVKNTKPGSYSSEPITSKKQKGNIIYVEPIKELREITLQWEIPFHYTETAAPDLTANLLSSEAKNSLSAHLKKIGWIEDLSAYSENLSKKNALFSVDIDLTKEGVKHLHSIIEQVFQTIALYKREKLPQSIYDEIHLMQIVNYQYQSRQNAFDVVKSHAHLMVEEPLETYPYHSTIIGKYDIKDFHDFLNLLSPQDMVCFVIAPQELTQVSSDTKEQCLGGHYSIQANSKEQMEKWAHAKPHSEVMLPQANPFVPKHLAVIPSTTEDIMQQPMQIIEEDIGEAYYYNNNRFKGPKSTLIIGIKSPLIDGQPKNRVLYDLFLKSLDEKLASTTQYAAKAGLGSSVGLEDFTMQIAVQGYSEKADKLLYEILAAMKTNFPTMEEFAIYKEALLSAYENKTKELPIYQAIETLSNVISNNAPTSQQKVRALQKLTYSDYEKYANELFNQTYIEAYFGGNLTEKEALTYWKNIKSQLKGYPYLKDEQAQVRVLALSDKQGPFQINQHSKLQGNGALLLIEEGSFSFEKSASQNMLNKLMHEAFFDELRTKQQTGYIAFSWSKTVHAQMLHYFAVQSSTHHPTELLSRFELFLEEYIRNFDEELSIDRFNAIKEMLIIQLGMPPKNLAEESSINYTLAYQFNGDFERKEKKIQALKELSYEQFKKDCIKFFSRNNSRRIAVLIEGQPTENKFFKYNRVSQELIKQSGTYISAQE